MITTPPLINEVEVTLIGTGGGYGESIIIKYGNDSWGIIDSCINPHTQSPLALEYLEGIKVDLKKINFILCTHWHNDHIRGLSILLKKCPNAEFCFARTTDLRKFLLMVSLDHQKAQKGSPSSTDEFKKCIDALNKSKFPNEVACDQVIDKLNESGIDFTIYSLSPSPKTCHDFNIEISELITDFGKRSTQIINKSPNNKSVALLFSFGEYRVLLGSDLEVGHDPNEGWLYILKNSKVLDKKRSSLFKLPHHGSANGYCIDIFNNLLTKDPVLKTTPFKTHDLPRKDMIKVYLNHSNNLFLTSYNEYNSKPKKRDKSLEKFIVKSVLSIEEIKFTHGIIRSRLDYTKTDSSWNIELFNAAIKVT